MKQRNQAVQQNTELTHPNNGENKLKRKKELTVDRNYVAKEINGLTNFKPETEG